jgi:hypothetical protein
MPGDDEDTLNLDLDLSLPSPPRPHPDSHNVAAHPSVTPDKSDAPASSQHGTPVELTPEVLARIEQNRLRARLLREEKKRFEANKKRTHAVRLRSLPPFQGSLQLGGHTHDHQPNPNDSC